MSTQGPVPQPPVQAQLSVRNGRAAVDFYKVAFGAVEVFRFGGTDDLPEVVAQLAVGSSLFWVEGETLLTPPLQDHILASITRGLIIEVTEAQEQSCPLDRLREAGEVFLASTTREVQPVVAVDESAYTASGPVSARTAEAVRERIEAELAV